MSTFLWARMGRDQQPRESGLCEHKLGEKLGKWALFGLGKGRLEGDGAVRDFRKGCWKGNYSRLLCYEWRVEKQKC